MITVGCLVSLYEILSVSEVNIVSIFYICSPASFGVHYNTSYNLQTLDKKKKLDFW